MKKLRRSKRGMALVMALFFVAIAVALLGGLSARLMSQRTQVQQYVTYRDCFNGLEAAYTEAKHELENGGSGYVGVTSWDPRTSGGWPTFDSGNVQPEALETQAGIEYIAVAQNWGVDGLDNNGDLQIDDVGEYGMYTLYAAARNGNVTRQSEAVLASSNVNVWKNAIFAGAGHVDGAMKGNVSIHGSVHILGNHIPDGGEAVTVLDMMGASLIHNNYSKGPGQTITARELASVPPLKQVLVNGELSDTLEASLRVKRGLVSLNSASEVGGPNVAGNAQKEYMDGTFVTDGWTGTKVTADGGRGDPTTVYSDNAWDELYDLGSKVQFPVMTDDWRWPAHVSTYEIGEAWTGVPGGTVASPDGDPYEHEEFFTEVLSDGNPYNGDVTMTRDGSAVYINLTRPTDSNPDHRVKDDPEHDIKGDDYLYFRPTLSTTTTTYTTQRVKVNGVWVYQQVPVTTTTTSQLNCLEVNGQVSINGNLTFTGPNGNSAKCTYYSGRGAILVSGNVMINGDLLPCNNADPNSYDTSAFPIKNCLGIMCKGDLTLGDTCSQMDIMGAFYAAGTIQTAKQTRICGTIVSTFFDFGDQVPDIFQVPALADYLPLGMIGNYPLLALSQVSWRELGVTL